MRHDYKPPGCDDYAWEFTVAQERACNIHVHEDVSMDEFITMRQRRDATLVAPVLLLPSIQTNVRAGRLPEIEPNGVRKKPALLIPFVQQHNPEATDDIVQCAYRIASLGELTAREFWLRVGVDPSLEDDYLVGHRLMPGLAALLDWASGMGFDLACLSNDVSMWSRKLRHGLDLSRRFEKWVISVDVGVRKPDPGIYQEVLQQLGVLSAELLFVNDRLANVEAAQRLGIRSILFSDEGEAASDQLVCRGFEDLRTCIERVT